MARYSDEYRASAVLMLQSQGYPDKKGALVEVANHLGIPHFTLSRWYNAASNPPPHKTVRIKKEQILKLIRGEIYGALSEMEHSRSEASYRDLATATGILIDKLQLLEGKPTNREEIIDDRLSDEDRVSRIATLLDRARARRDRQSSEEDSRE